MAGMRATRVFSLVALVGLIASAARPAASAPVDLQAEAYGGTASGGWACGPSARVNYGGVGGSIQVRPAATAKDANTGLAFSATAAGEHRDYSLIDCAGSDCTVPPSSFATGGSLKGGYDWDGLGFRAGVVVGQYWGNNEARSPTGMVLPDVSLRFGPLTRFRAEVGIGSWSPTTVLRPAILWTGAAYTFHSGVDVSLHGGLNETFVGDVGVRGDLAVAFPIAEDLLLGVGGALSTGDSHPEPEGRVMLIAHVW